MNDLTLVLAAAVLTYGSRAAATAVLPTASGRVLEFIDRLPAPLFAGLAVFALVGSPASVPDWPTMAAAIGALVAAPRRSLGLTLAVGLAAYALVAWLV